jgi:hypothetical protein
MILNRQHIALYLVSTVGMVKVDIWKGLLVIKGLYGD